MAPVYGAKRLLVEYEEDTRAKYVIEGEDHTLGNLLEKVLASMEGVKMAYYEVPHPLENKIIVYIVTDGSVKPREALRKALHEIIAMNEEFRRLYLNVLRERGVDVSEWQS